MDTEQPVGILERVSGAVPAQDGWGRDNWSSPNHEATYSCGHVLTFDYRHNPPNECYVCTGQWPKSAASNYKNVHGRLYPVSFTRDELRTRAWEGVEGDKRFAEALERANAEWSLWGEE